MQSMDKQVLNCRAQSQAKEFTTLLNKAGLQVVEQPAIQILPIKESTQIELIKKTLATIHSFEALVFVSSNGVKHFFSQLKSSGASHTSLRNKKCIAIGSKTAEAARQFGIDCQSPGRANSESLADFLIQRHPSQRLLILRADRGSDVLSNRLKAAGVSFEELAIYRSCDVTELDPKVANLLVAGEIDWIPFASSASARSLLRLVSNLGTTLKRPPRIASISPTTSTAIKQAGFEVTVEAKTYDLTGIIDALTAYEAGPTERN